MDSDFAYETLRCPSCNAPFSMEHAGNEVRCAYCGSVIHIRRREVACDGTLVVKDSVDGRPIAHVRIPFGWRITGGALDYSNPTFEYPLCVLAEACDDKGSVIRYRSGESFIDMGGFFSLSMPDAPNKRPFQDPVAYLDQFIRTYVGAGGIPDTTRASGTRETPDSALIFLEQRALPQYEPLDKAAGKARVERIAQREAARQSIGQGSFKVVDTFFDGLASIYRLQTGDGTNLKLAVATCIEGYKTLMLTAGMGGLDPTLFEGIGEKVSGLFGGGTAGGSSTTNGTGGFGSSGGGGFLDKMVDSGLLGGMLGKKYKESRSRQTASPSPAADGIPPNPAVGDRVADNKDHGSDVQEFAKRRGGQLVIWQSRHLFILQAAEDEFEQAYDSAFTDFCSTLQIDEAINAMVDQMQEQEIRKADQNLQRNLDAQQRQFQAYQQAHAAQVAAFDSYNQAWWDRQNSSFESNRNAYQSRLASEDRIREKYSEAVRGVNTYMRPDGSEVELSTGSDTAWTNDRGDILGGSGGFDPGSGWTQMGRKY